MKYLLILLLPFVFINPALAARTVSGTVPKLVPLQPIPPDVFPNYSKNIQYQDPNYLGNPAPNSGQSPQKQPPQSPVSGQPSSAAALVQSSPVYHYVWWLVGLLAVLLLVYWFYKRSKSK